MATACSAVRVHVKQALVTHLRQSVIAALTILSVNDAHAAHGSERARRDLHWLLAHSPIVSGASQANLGWLATAHLKELRSDLEGVIDTLSDQALEAALQERRSGRYFEALVVALLRGSQRFEVLAHDLQVREDKRTVGAFDVVLRDLQQDVHIHLELAFKQYLHRKGDPTLMHNWVGPRGRDRLDLKYSHMQERQLQLGATPAGQSCLRSLGVQHYQRWALMAGRLFLPWESFRHGPRPDLPAHCEPNVEWGWWMGAAQRQTLENLEHKPRLLSPRWALAPLQPEDCGALPAYDGQLVDAQLGRGVPVLVAVIDDSSELSRGWIVPEV